MFYFVFLFSDILLQNDPVVTLTIFNPFPTSIDFHIRSNRSECLAITTNKGSLDPNTKVAIRISVKKLFGDDKIALQVIVKDYYDASRSDSKVIPVSMAKKTDTTISPSPTPASNSLSRYPSIAASLLLLAILLGLFPSLSSSSVTEPNDLAISVKIFIAFVLGVAFAFASRSAMQ